MIAYVRVLMMDSQQRDRVRLNGQVSDYRIKLTHVMVYSHGKRVVPLLYPVSSLEDFNPEDHIALVS